MQLGSAMPDDRHCEERDTPRADSCATCIPVQTRCCGQAAEAQEAYAAAGRSHASIDKAVGGQHWSMRDYQNKVTRLPATPG